MSTTAKPRDTAAIEHIQYVRATPAQVYDALTSQQGLAEVWTDTLTVQAVMGAVNEFHFGDAGSVKVKIVEWLPRSRLAWRCLESDPQWVGTQISFDLERRDDSTAVVLRHEGWREVTEFYRWCNYNWAMFLYSLKSYCEDGAGLPFQRRRF